MLPKSFQIDQDKEHFNVMHLDSHRRINLVELVAIGTLIDTNVHPRETFRRAIVEGSYSIIVAHNHPSGGAGMSPRKIFGWRIYEITCFYHGKRTTSRCGSFGL